ncbi:hypothetical protein F0562_005010 [Nyssa sinensis]|uniref:LOB domain-containing protein n=1 Tax=Nyssa sinensis TaxID=561372 RepID=A0A5J5AMJ1_9ASTE|nr:hypothetical protein F0562_005010 [Nyssa sinensis]
MQPFSSSELFLLSLSLLIACRLLLPKMTVKGGTSQACAACKYQRRRCSSECALARYFPANQPKMFQNAHRLFGVCNIMKILRLLESDEQKDEAMKSIIYESDMRERFPVHGCWGIIWQLRQQLLLAIEELQYVKAKLTICREQWCSTHFSELQLGHVSPTNNDALPIFQHHSTDNAVPLSLKDHFVLNENDGAFIESNDDMVKPLWVQHPYYDNMINNNSMGIQSSQAFETLMCQDYDDIPFNTIADDRQSYIESKDVCESSSESSLKDTTQSIEYAWKNELRSAAACFSLTN